MKRVTFQTVWTNRELNKVFNAIKCYNKTFDDEIVIEKIEGDEKSNFTYITISYVNEPNVLMWFGILLGRRGL